MKALRVSASVLKILVGMMFIISAVSKFITIDSFEMYIFSFGLFPLGISFYVARFVLAFELILGASLISHRNHRFAVLMSLLFLLCFVVFLTYAHLVGRTDSCHCFGEMLPFDPVQSILKNAVLVILLLFVYKFTPADWFPRWWLVVLIYLATAVLTFFCMVHSFHALDMLALVMMLVMLGVGILASLPFYGKWYVTTVLILAPIVTTFILTPPDSWFYTNTDERFDEELFLQQLEPAADTGDTLAVSATPAIPLQDGRNIVAFFSPKCGICQLAAEKISTIMVRNDLDSTRITYVFPQVSDTASYARFYEASRSSHYREIRIDKETFIKITRASFPIVLLVDNGEVTASFAYRNINEKLVTDFLGNK